MTCTSCLGEVAAGALVCPHCGEAPGKARKPPPPRSARSKAAGWVVGLGIAVLTVWGLLRSSEQLPTAQVRTEHEAADIAAAVARFGGQPGIYGTVRIPAAHLADAPKGGALIVEAHRASLASGQLAAREVLPAPVGVAAVQFHLGPEDAVLAGAFEHEVNLSAHWAAAGASGSVSPGDLKGSCASNPLLAGQKVGVIVLGVKVGVNDPMAPY
jgi:hypothetical protein